MKFHYAYAAMLNSAVPSVTIEDRQLTISRHVYVADTLAGRFDIVLANRD
jgi:hypothetical protein